MIEFLQTYAPWGLTAAAIIGPILPSLISGNKLSNKTMRLIEEVRDRDIEVGSLRTIVEGFRGQVKELKAKIESFEEHIIDLKADFRDFKSSEMYNSLLDTMIEIKELKNEILTKNETIDYLANTIKEINKKL